jgi:thymidylate synthase (FAD)
MKTAPMKVELLDAMGTDLTVVNAARVSFAKESALVYRWDEDADQFRGSLQDADARLIRYLAKHGHWTPFGHCTAQFRIKAPIFVARQLVKHQVGLVWNEVSRRYVDDEPEFWFPETWRARADNVKQGSSETETVVWLDREKRVATVVRETAAKALETYQDLLAAGVAPEQARIVLPQNTMTEWWWTGSLMAFARVCKLRLDPHAQAETREVAVLLAEALHDRFPVSWNALVTTDNT